MLGTRISHYRLTGRLGEGGMGVVYEAVDEMLGRPVALKFPSAEITSTGQLAAEARAASRLNHPNVAQIYEFGETGDGGAFIAMELVRGRTLRDVLADGPLPPAETLRIVRAVAEALDEAHREGIMHLDIKPGNIAIGERGVVKVLDFGLARSLPPTALDPDDPRTRTMTHELRGTPSYMSPEQARALPLDARSDLFSLGAVMYECLTGRRAFPGRSAVSALLEVVSTDPPAPSAVARGIPRRLDAIVRKLLAKDPAARYPSAAALIAALDAGAQVRRRPRSVLAAAALAAALAIAGGSWYAWRQLHPSPRQVVVLPFENLTGHPEEAAFCEGLADVVTGLLSQRDTSSAGVWVVPSSDVRHYGVQTVAAALRTLHADLAITGSVEPARGAPGWTIRINACDAAHARVLDSRTIVVEQGKTAELESKLNTALAELLAVRAPNRHAQPTPAYARFVRARGLLRDSTNGENLTRAIAELESITKESPNFAPADVALGDAYFRLYFANRQPEWLAKADQAVRRAADLNEDEPGVHSMLGRILNATGQTEAAIRELKTALARDPGDVAALLQLAGAYANAKRNAEAEATYLEATRLRPSYFPAYMNLGVLYLSEGKLQQADEALTLVTRLAPDYADGYTTLGSVEYYLDRLDEAKRRFTRSIELKPTVGAYSNRCGIDFDQNDMRAAEADCRKAIDLQPGSPTAWGNLADVLVEEGKRPEATEAYAHALEAGGKRLAINPVDPELLGSMAKYAAKTGQKALAVEYASRAVEQGNGMRVLYKTGIAFGLTGNCARSAELIRQALDKGYSKSEARRDRDLARLRAAPLACQIPAVK